MPRPLRPFLRSSTLAYAIGMLACAPSEDGYAASPGNLALMADMPDVSFHELQRGTGRPVFPGDRVTIYATGHYGKQSDRFVDGQLTFISGEHPNGNLLGPAAYAARAGARRRFTIYIRPDSSTGVRVATYGGMFPERESFRYRHDRGALTFDTEVITVCRPRRVTLMEGSKFEMRFSLGCA